MSDSEDEGGKLVNVLLTERIPVRLLMAKRNPVELFVFVDNKLSISGYSVRYLSGTFQQLRCSGRYLYYIKTTKRKMYDGKRLEIGVGPQ